MTKPKVVHVTWRDSAAYQGWLAYDAEKAMRHLIESVGYLVAETDDHLAIASSHDDDPDGTPWAQMTIIPSEAIVKKRVVRDG